MIYYEIHDAMHASRLKVNRGYIIYNDILYPKNMLQWYWNTNTKEYLWESITALMSQDSIPKLFQEFVKLYESFLTYKFEPKQSI